MVPGDVPISGPNAGQQGTPSSSTALPSFPRYDVDQRIKGSSGWMDEHLWQRGWGGEPEIILYQPSVLLGGWAENMEAVLWQTFMQVRPRIQGLQEC